MAGRGVRSWVVLAAVAAVAATGAWAQTRDTGRIEGTVADETGAVLPNVAVQVIQVETGQTRSLTTDERGRYRAVLLSAGTYTITAELSGFAKISREGVVLHVGESLSVDVTLQPAGVEEVLTVTGEAPIIETTRTTESTLLNRAAVENLPVNGRDFRDFALLAPGAGSSPGLRSPLRFNGQQGDYTGLTVDGADYTDPFFAEFSGSLETKNFAISQEAIQEFQVLTNGFEAEFGRSTGAIINVISKSGTNTFHGGIHEFWRNHALASNDAFGNEPIDFNQNQFGGYIGGPIAQDKAFFFFATDIQRRDAPLIVQFLRDVEGIGIPELGIANLGDLEGDIGQSVDLDTYFGKVDFALNQDHHVSFRVNYSKNDTVNFTGGQGQEVVSGSESNFEDFEDRVYSVYADLTSVLSDKAFNEFKFQVIDETRPRAAKGPGPEIQIFDTTGGGGIGRRFFLPIEGTTRRWQFTNNFSYLFGDHDLKMGVDYVYSPLIQNVFIGFASGVYLFPNLEAFQARQPLGFIQQVGFNQGVTEANTLAEPFKQHDLGVYFQDKWQPTSTLTLNLGLRYEAQYNDPSQAPVAGSFNSENADDTNNWAPRFGFAWDPTGSGKTVVRGGSGLYYGRTASIFFVTNGSGLKSGTVFAFPPPGNLVFPDLLPEVVTGPNDPNLPFPLGNPNITFTDPNFENPRVWQTTLGVEHEIMEETTVGATFSYSETDFLRRGGGFIDFDANLPPQGSSRTCGFAGDSDCVDSFGRYIWPPAPFGGPAGARPDPEVTKASVSSSEAESEYKSLTLWLRRGLTKNVQGFVNYTLSQSEGNADTQRDTEVFLGASDPLNPDVDFGTDDLDIRHRLNAQALFELPYEISFATLLTWRSGRSAAAYIGFDYNNDGNSGARGIFSDRPIGPDGQLVPRFPERQPNFFTFDIRLLKAFDLGDAGYIEGSFEVFNLFNNDNLESNQFFFADPAYLDLNLPGPRREIQLGIRYRF